MTLLVGGKAQPVVCSFIMDMVDKLLTTADYGTEEIDDEDDTDVVEEPVYMQLDFGVDQHQPAKDTEEGDSKGNTNLGSTLLIPHISPILGYLRTIISKGLSARDLNVLMRISEFINDSDLSSELSRLLVPAIKAIVLRHTKNSSAIEDTLTQYLNSLANLLLTASNPQSFLG